MNNINSNYTDNIVCPYCGYEIDYCGEDITCDGDYEKMYCNSCSKSFMYTAHHTYTFTSKKCDCLNGGEHQWEYYHKFEDYILYICKSCNETERRYNT